MLSSNGIRFSITDLGGQSQRILPAAFLDRAAISLYDAQWQDGKRVPIPVGTISKVVEALKRFGQTVQDFGVDASKIRVLATEATRTALNSEELRNEIKLHTGWTVDLLPKEMEGKIGAYGVASSYDEVWGLVMDLGGGSTQITWMKTEYGTVKISDVGSVSLPYGAAALTKRLEALERENAHSLKAFEEEVVENLRAAVKTIELPEDLVHADTNGLNLYLTGGGFRGWGFVLMSEHQIKPYPIPIINGFHVTSDAFQDTTAVTTAVKKVTEEETPEIFRVSDRRASQVPAVAFLVNCLSHALRDMITDVYFCQGGVREGFLFLEELDWATRGADPFVTATLPNAPPSTEELVSLLIPTICPPPSTKYQRAIFRRDMLTTFVQAMYVHSAYPKDVSAGAALRSTTTGIFANTHGVSHEQRATLALLLCERYGGFKSISPTEQDFYHRMSQLLPKRKVWWCILLGRVAAVLGNIFPAGLVPDWRVTINVEWTSKKHDHVLCIDFEMSPQLGYSRNEGLKKLVGAVEKAGKRKNWVDGKGYKVLVTVNGREMGES